MSLPPEQGSDSTSRHACHCGKSFVRKEHLTRHQATHDKPAYICTVCQRQFSRKDLLRRHSILHEASHTRIVVSCDACRANKTKCSGGNQCLLCARRGIDCTFQGNLRRSKGASTSDDFADVNPSIRGDDNDDGPILPISRPENALVEQALRIDEELQPNVEFLQSLTIVPSQPAPMSEFQPLSGGMEAVYELLAAEKPSLETAIEDSDELQGSVTQYLETYFKNFHIRWPIIHAPTFDNEVKTVSLPLAASVCVIGAWFQSSARWTERFYALRMHELLLQRLLPRLIDPELMFEGQAWPIELFQAVLLTLIFSLYRTDKNALSRTMLLRSTFITILREIGAFDAESLANHLKTYFSGPYTPYTLSMRERFKRLLVLTYQFDAYFALAHEKPPILHRQEVCVDLPSTFALWNTYGLDIFATRRTEEPSGRSEVKMSEMTNHPESFTSSQLLVEDVQLGLCGLLQAIWVLKQSFLSKTRGYLGDSVQKQLLIETLDEWKYELDKIKKLADPRNITSNTAKYLLLAYRGQDDSVVASLERITTLVQDGLVFYYYLRMYHYAGLGASGVVGRVTQIDDPRTETLQISKYKREALVCAIQMLKIVESIGASRASLNPLIWHALAQSTNVTKLLVSSQKCECLDKEGQHATNMNLQQWTEIGGAIWIDDTPVCVCKLKFWTDRFEKAIQDQKIMVEQADSTESA